MGQAGRMRIIRRDDPFLKWTHDYREGRHWPLEGFVAVVGSEAQDAVFLPSRLVEELGQLSNCQRVVNDSGSEVPKLRPSGRIARPCGENWTSDRHRLVVSRAIELVEYEIGNHTGVAV